jgi:hypothetical protein
VNHALLLSRASLAAELKRRGLKRAKVGASRRHIQKGTGGRGEGIRPYFTGSIVTTTSGSSKTIAIAGDTQWSGSARQAPIWEFIEDRSGTIYRLREFPQPSARSKDIHICGCKKQVCGPVGSGCPACGATTQWMYTLPPGAKYGGYMVVKFDSPEATFHYKTKGCPRRRICPKPPSSPRR